ncbi:hypothetical protein BDQ17DRAFT_1433596 [Cyathus striatus]|nr:hypothetical protein BDQ17DRAFT_1433596 [Cyathus striatus]
MIQAQHTNILTLKAYINALPASMPLPEDGASVLWFLDFSLNNEWIEDASEEAAWLVDGVNSVAACLKENSALLPTISINPLSTSFDSVKQTLLVPNQKSKAKPATSAVSATKKPDSKLLQSEMVKNYIDTPEPVDNCKGGQRCNSLLMKATWLCYHVDKPDTPLAHCVASSGCCTQMAVPRDLT